MNKYLLSLGMINGHWSLPSLYFAKYGYKLIVGYCTNLALLMKQKIGKIFVPGILLASFR